MKKILEHDVHLNWKIAVLTIGSVLLLMVNSYHPTLVPWEKITFLGKNITPGWFAIPAKAIDRVLLYLVIPLLITLLLFRENPRDYGFTLGNWRTGLILTMGGIILLAPILWLVSRNSLDMQGYYRSQVSGLPWNTFVDLFGWEFFFRGWLLFGYAKKFGPEAIWIQAIPFAMAHIGKPEVETLSTIFGGFAFGWVAWKTKSFFWPFLIHWFVASFTILVAAGLIG